MKQLKQSQFVKNGIEHENISSPETSASSTRVISISIDKYGKFQYTTDGVNYIELDPQTSEITSVDTIYDDVSELPEGQQYGTILPAYTNTALPVILYEYTEDDGWVEKQQVNEYSIYYVTDKGTLYIFIGTDFVSTTPEQTIKIISPSSNVLTDEEYNILVANNCVLGTTISGLDWAEAGTILTKPFEYNGSLRGMYIRNSKIGTYLVTISTKTIGNGATDIVLNQVAQFNGKAVPTYPANSGTFNLQIVDGTIQWNTDNYVTLNTAQTITGKKTIRGELEFQQSSDSGGTSKLSIKNDNGYNAKIKMGNTENMRIMTGGTYFGATVGAIADNTTDLGVSNARWKDVYVGGLLKDGSNANYGLAIPSQSSYTANKTIATAEDVASGYVAKNTTEYSTKRVYGQGTQGDERMIQTSPNAYGQFLVERDANGMFNVNEPTENTHPASKNYVDTGLGTKQNTIDANNMLDADLVDDTTATHKFATSSELSQIATNTGDISTINGKIPSEATSSNQLADKAFVNSSINNFAAYYITKNVAGDPFDTKAQLFSASTFYSGGSTRTPTINDYAIVTADETKGVIASGYASFTTTADYVDYYVIYNNESVLVTDANKDDLGITAGTTIAYESLPTTRYSYQGGTYPNGQWEYQYSLNNTSFTQAQMNALNSGIDSTKVGQIATNASNITSLQSNKANDNAVVHLAGAETITGVKTFSNGLKVDNYTIDKDSFGQLQISNANTTSIQFDGDTVRTKNLVPIGNNSRDLGSSGQKWKDLYLSGKVDFGNNATITKDSSDRLNLNYNSDAKVKVGSAEVTIKNRIGADSDNAQDIGRSSVRWRDLYLAGQIKDGNNTDYGLVLPDTTSYTANKTIATTDQIPTAITSINGLAGGQLTSPLTLAGGSEATASKISVGTDGRITDSGNSTIFGRSGTGGVDLLVGQASYNLKLRGSGTRPTFNGNDVALKSDVPSAITITTTSGSESISDGTNTLNVVTRDTAQTISGEKTFTGNIKNSGTYYIGSGNVVLASMSGSDLTLGNSSSALKFAGSGTRPTYNGSSLALQSDVPNIPTTSTPSKILTSTSTSGSTAWKTKTELNLCTAFPLTMDIDLTDNNDVESVWTLNQVTNSSGIAIKYGYGTYDFISVPYASLIAGDYQDTTYSGYDAIRGQMTIYDGLGKGIKKIDYLFCEDAGGLVEGSVNDFSYYPIGAIYISQVHTSPASLFGGNWTALDGNTVLWTQAWTSSTTTDFTVNASGSKISASLPNITGSFGKTGNNPIGGNTQNSQIDYAGAFTTGRHGQAGGFGNGNGYAQKYWIDFDASRSSSIYNSNTTTVQPPAQKVYAWRRVS